MGQVTNDLRQYGLWLLAGAALAAPVAAQVGLGLTPMKMEFPAAAGKAYSGTLTLSNSAEKKVRIRTELLDFYIDGNQTPQFLPGVPAEAEHSCRQWLSVNPMEAELEPKSQIQARYTVRIPAEAGERSFHCAIGFTSMPTEEDLRGIGVRTAVRVVTTIYPVVGQPNIQGDLVELALEPVLVKGKTRWRGVVVLENAGLMLFRPQGSVEVVDAGGSVVETLRMGSTPALPRRKQRYLLPLKSELAEGRYTLRARVDVGTEVQEASAEVSAAPLQP